MANTHDEMSVIQAAKAIGVSPASLYERISHGTVAARRERVTEFRYFVPRAVVEELAAARRQNEKAA